MTHKFEYRQHNHTAITVHGMTAHKAPRQNFLYLSINAYTYNPNLAKKVQKERQRINTNTRANAYYINTGEYRITEVKT